MRDIVVAVDGSCLHNGQPYAIGGWGAVISLPGVRAEACEQICNFCNPTHSNSLAEIHAVQFAQMLLQEVVKMGHPLHLNPDGSRCRRTAPHKHDTFFDGRPCGQKTFNFLVRSDSQYVVNGLYGRINLYAHSDLWDDVFSFDKSIEQNGSIIEYEHVYGHNGDRFNERADYLARHAAGSDGCGFYKCNTCEHEFSDCDGLAFHLKEVHMNRDLTEEMEQVYDFYEYDGEYVCSICERVFDQLYSVWQHNMARH